MKLKFELQFITPSETIAYTKSNGKAVEMERFRKKTTQNNADFKFFKNSFFNFPNVQRKIE